MRKTIPHAQRAETRKDPKHDEGEEENKGVKNNIPKCPPRRGETPTRDEGEKQNEGKKKTKGKRKQRNATECQQIINEIATSGVRHRFFRQEGTLL